MKTTDTETRGSGRPASRSLRNLWEKVKEIEIAMLVTVGPDGKMLEARPMATQALESKDCLWFFAARDSGKVEAIEEHPEVLLTYAAPDRGVFVSASGHARVVDNDDKAREMWSRSAQGWFKGGPDDPNLALIVVDVDEAKWWDGMEAKSLDLH